MGFGQLCPRQKSTNSWKEQIQADKKRNSTWLLLLSNASSITNTDIFKHITKVNTIVFNTCFTIFVQVWVANIIADFSTSMLNNCQFSETMIKWISAHAYTSKLLKKFLASPRGEFNELHSKINHTKSPSILAYTRTTSEAILFKQWCFINF